MKLYRDGVLWDRDSRPWHRELDWLEPEQTEALVTAGTPWLIEWCDGGATWSDEPGAPSVTQQILPRLIGRRRADRMRRQQRTRTVLVAESWRDDSGNALVVLVETAPAPRHERALA